MADAALTDAVLRLGAVAGGGFVLAAAAPPLVIRWARRRGWLARPTADRWHERPTALMGGIAIYAAGTLGQLVVVGALPPAVWTGATVLFAAGWLDDRYGLTPPAKLAAQVGAALLLLPAGYAFGDGPLWLAGPLTVVWVVGITNAVNLLDNMDGLAAGVVAVAALALVVLLGAGGLATTALVSVVGAALGFLCFNFNPARVFMGDSGSLFLGYTVAALALAVPAQLPPGAATWLLPAWLLPVLVLAVPIFDTALVTVGRLRAGRPVAQGGRDHSSHRLVLSGYSERRAVLSLYALALAAASAACAYVWAGPVLFGATALVVAAALIGLARRFSRIPVYAAEQMAP